MAFYSRPGLYLNFKTLSNDENLNIPGCNLLRADRLSDTKRGGVCIYFKESLPIRLYNVSYLNECICVEIMISNKLCNFISLYRSPSQSSDEFENFSYNLDLTLEAFTQKNPFLTVIIGDFNVKFSNWCSTDKITPEETFKGTNPISDNYRSCINLIFTSQPNLVVDFGTHSSLHENCYHQIVYSKFDLKIFYPPPYERTVWHYQQADTQLIKRPLESFDWKNAVSNGNPNEQVSVLTKTLLIIMSNFIPNETILVDDRDPPWITRKLKSVIQEKNLFCKKYLKPNNQETFQAFSQIQERVRLAIEDSKKKKKYYEKLSNKLSISLVENVIKQL